MPFTKGHTINKGYKMTEEHKLKISQSKKGKALTVEHKLKLRGSRPKASGENNHQWKGDKASLSALHSWVKHRLGKAVKCIKCKTKDTYRYEWSNVSGKYLRDLTDWQQLCIRCHRKYDDNVNKMWKTRKANN